MGTMGSGGLVESAGAAECCDCLDSKHSDMLLNIVWKFLLENKTYLAVHFEKEHFFTIHGPPNGGSFHLLDSSESHDFEDNSSKNTIDGAPGLVCEMNDGITVEEEHNNACEQCTGVTIKLRIEPLSEGNLNYVFRITASTSLPKGFGEQEQERPHEAWAIMKFAPDFIKCLGPDYPLSSERLLFEHQAFIDMWELFGSPASVGSGSRESNNGNGGYFSPKVYRFCSEKHAMLVEDFRHSKVLRNEKIKCAMPEWVPGKIGDILGRLYCTSVSMGIADSRKGNRNGETWGIDYNQNLMIGITEQYVFTKPFIWDDETNQVKTHPHLIAFTDTAIYQNKQLLDVVKEMKRAFVGTKEVFCHGDLHTGSIMFNESSGSVQLIDAEFAMIGCKEFDMSCVLGSFVLSFFAHHALAASTHLEEPTKRDNHAQMCRLTSQGIIDVWDAYVGTCEKEKVYDYAQLDIVIKLTCIEIMRRILGAAPVDEIKILEGVAMTKDSPINCARTSAELGALRFATESILKAKEFRNINDFARSLFPPTI
eukprot:Nk52_evm6s383 gene=Nk52_evmTU6s383